VVAALRSGDVVVLDNPAAHIDNRRAMGYRLEAVVRLAADRRPLFVRLRGFVPRL
jgi:hypothetical protein